MHCRISSPPTTEVYLAVVVFPPQSSTHASPFRLKGLPLHVQLVVNPLFAVAPEIASHSALLMHELRVGEG